MFAIRVGSTKGFSKRSYNIDPTARGPSLFGNFVEGNYLEMLFLD
jgi:hypothetical protein